MRPIWDNCPVFAFRVPDVGDGLAARFWRADTKGVRNGGAQIDCGSQQQPNKALDQMQYVSPECFILTHFHWDHFNALSEAIRDPGRYRRLAIRQLCFPRFPDFTPGPDGSNRMELARVFFALTARVMGQETGIAEADLLRLFQRLNTRPFSYRALSKGDRLQVADCTVDVLWPPRTIDEEGTLKVIRTAITKFRRALEEDTRLQQIYYVVSNMGMRVLEENISDMEALPVEESRRFEPTAALSQNVLDALAAQRSAANHLSLSFRIHDRLLVLGDLEKNQIGEVIRDIAASGPTRFDYLLTPHHGTHWHDELNNVKAQWAVSSAGPRLTPKIKMQYKQIATAHWITHLQGSWYSRRHDALIRMWYSPLDFD